MYKKYKILNSCLSAARVRSKDVEDLSDYQTILGHTSQASIEHFFKLKMPLGSLIA